ADLGPGCLPPLRRRLHPGAEGAVRAEDGAQREPHRCRGGGRGLRPALRLRRPARARPADARRRRGGHRRRRPRCPTGADDPDAADGGAVQRRGRRRGGAGRAAGAAAHDRRRRRRRAAGLRPRRDGVHDLRGLGVVRRLAGHLRQAAGADDLEAGDVPRSSRPVRAPAGGSDRPFGGHGHRRRAGLGGRPVRRRAGLRRTPGAAGRWRRRADRDLAAQRVHRPHCRRGRLRAGQHRPARGRHARGLGGHVPHPAHGAGHGAVGGQHHVRRAQGRLDARWRSGVGPPGQVRWARRRRDRAGVRLPGDHRPRLRAGRRPGAAHAARARRPAPQARHQGRLRDPPGGRPHAGPHERPARRGPGPLRAADRDGRHQRRVQAHRRGARGGRKRRGEPGGEDHSRGTDLRDADPQRRRGAPDRVHEALDAARLRRHRERAALRPQDDTPLRRRQGLTGQAAQGRRVAL
ncbi:MAG: NAD(P) transhydrogenase subunit beta, partial [uncultured Nocardioidaceae bacterium]